MRTLFYSLCTLCILLTLGGCTSGGQLYVLDQQTPSEIVTRPVDVTTYLAKYPGEEAVYLNHEQVIELVNEQPFMSKASYYLSEVGSLRYIVLNPDKEWTTTFRMSVGRGKELVKAFITVISPDGTVKQFTKDDLKKEKDENGRTRYLLAYPNVVVGTVIDEGYEIWSDPLVNLESYFSLPLQFSVPCEQVSARFAYPAHWDITTRDGESMVTWSHSSKSWTEDGSVIESYRASNVPALRNEPYSPYITEVRPVMEALLNTIDLPQMKAIMNYKSWKEQEEGMAKPILGKRGSKDKSIRAHVSTLVSASDTDPQKVQKIVDWVYANIKLDESDYKIGKETRQAYEVLEDKKGYPMEITNLTRVMLMSAGLDATYLMLHSADEPAVTTNFVYSRAFTTPSVKVKTKDSTYFLFPYIRNYPIGRIPSFFEGQPALILDEEEYRGFDTIPVATGGGSSYRTEYDITIDDEGVSHVVETQHLQGDEDFLLRLRLEDMDEDEKEEMAKELVSYEGGELTFRSYEIQNADDYNRPLMIRMEYDVDGIVAFTGDEALVRFEDLFSTTSRRKTKVDTDMRQNAIRIYEDEETVKTITVHLPKEWRLQTVPAPISEKSSFGDAAAEYSFTPGLLTINYHRNLQRASRPASDYPDLLKLIGTKTKLNVGTMVFSVEG